MSVGADDDAASLRRVALVVAKSLSPGQAANAAALLMGQLARLSPALYAEALVRDSAGRGHAAIRYSTVVLRAGSGQLATLASRLGSTDDVHWCCFSIVGQGLHNAFDEYVEVLGGSEPELVGVGLAGADGDVRGLTRAYSLLA